MKFLRRAAIVNIVIISINTFDITVATKLHTVVKEWKELHSNSLEFII